MLVKVHCLLCVNSILTGTKPPGPASKTGATPLGKSGGSQSAGKGGAANASAGKGGQQALGKGGAGGKLGVQNAHQVTGNSDSGLAKRLDEKNYFKVHPQLVK